MDDRYTILGTLGSGGAGEVFLARDGVLGREVALKVLSRRHAGDGGFAERFRREARSAAALSHPNIVAVHDLGEIREDTSEDAPVTLYITMEYVPGTTLRGLIRERGALAPRAAAAIALGAARGLEEAHRRGIVHRDVKPANILLCDPSWEASGNERPEPGPPADEASAPAVVKVADFGIARVVSEETLTEDDAMMGTAHYLSPEQATGAPVGPASDLYSLGVVLYEMLTGRRPFEAGEAEGPFALAIKHVTEEPRPPTEANPEVPRELDALVVRLLCKDPGERPTSVAALVCELERILEGAGGAPPEGPKPRPGHGNFGDPEGAGEGPSSSDTVPAETEAASGIGAQRRRDLRKRRGLRRRPVLLTALGMVVALAGAALALAFAPGVDLTFGGGQEGRGAVDAPREQEAESAAPPKENPAVLAARAAEDYYGAVDREEWSYTYDRLDSQARREFTEEEWFRKNQWFADIEGLELSSIDVETKDTPSETVAEVRVDRTFKDGTSIVRDTFFVYEDGSWKHRLSEEEEDLFMPGATFEEFVATNRTG